MQNDVNYCTIYNNEMMIFNRYYRMHFSRKMHSIMAIKNGQNKNFFTH